MSEFEELFRAMGWNNQDEVVFYSHPRRSYEEAVADLGLVFAARGVFSAGVEKRWVKSGTVVFVEGGSLAGGVDPGPVSVEVEVPAAGPAEEDAPAKEGTSGVPKEKVAAKD